MKQSIAKELLNLKKRTGWSWERIGRELHRVMEAEGPAHTTLYRYASERVKRPNVVIERWVRTGIERVEAEGEQ